MHLPLPPTSTQKLLSSLDVLEEIFLLACLNEQVLGLPVALHALSLSCKYFADILSRSENAAFFNRLFVLAVGFSPNRHTILNDLSEYPFRTFWVFLKTFRDAHLGRSRVSDISVNVWTFISTFMGQLNCTDVQTYRQLLSYAHIDQVARSLLLEVLPKAAQRKNPKAWLATGVWWRCESFRSSQPFSTGAPFDRCFQDYRKWKQAFIQCMTLSYFGPLSS
jgi:hypothetical protein